MKLTPLERRNRIYEMLDSDPECAKMKAEYESARSRFTKLTDRLPERLRNLLWTYPGMGYFLHHRTLNLICEHMKFPDEE